MFKIEASPSHLGISPSHVPLWLQYCGLPTSTIPFKHLYAASSEASYSTRRILAFSGLLGNRQPGTKQPIRNVKKISLVQEDYKTDLAYKST